MHPVWIDIAGRLQDKTPLMNPGMWNDEPIGREHAVIEKENVQIENSRTEPNAPLLSTCQPLNVLKRMQQVVRIEVCFDTHHTVHEPILIEHMHGFRPIVS